MLKRRKPPPTGIRTKPQARSAAHLQWVRGHVCAVEDDQCAGKIEAAHVRRGTDGGMGVKPSDHYVIPLCQWHHAEQHRIGEGSFEQRYAVSMLRLAEELARRSPALAKVQSTSNEED